MAAPLATCRYDLRGCSVVRVISARVTAHPHPGLLPREKENVFGGLRRSSGILCDGRSSGKESESPDVVSYGVIGAAPRKS